MLLRRIPLSTTLITLSGFLAFIAIASITVGPMNISFTDSLRGLIGAHSELAPHIQLVINEIRLPRTILCMFIGAILAICGVVMQGLFRNPLAEPGIIGVSAGAALGGAFAIVV
ncbi:iron chelate uptake ABC transporter family permease subunit, partial [Vibrio sp. 2099]